MSQSTYRHYPSFIRRYVRSVMKMMGLPKKPRIEAEIFDEMIHNEQVVHSINGEILMLEWHHGREGRVVVPEPSLSEWLQSVQLSRVQGDAWSWPEAFSTPSFPTGQTFHGHPVEGALVAWVDSTELPARYEAFLSAHGNLHGVDMEGLGDPWLIVAIHNPLDVKPSENPTMLRGAFKPSQITDFINSEAIEHAGGRVQTLADEEGMILRAVVRYVLSLGMYLSAYPEALSSGVPGWMKNKHPEGKKGLPFARVGIDREDRELTLAMSAPRSVSPYWRQLRDERFYRGKWADHRRGSRYVLVSGYEVGADKNVAPGTWITAVRRLDEESSLVLDSVWWGYQPRWTSEDAPQPINARVEKVATSKYFRGAFAHHRCLVPASGWFEWASADGKKQPYYLVREDGEPLWLAGIWTERLDGKPGCAILTEQARGVAKQVHDRMPLALSGESLAPWLDSNLTDRVAMRQVVHHIDISQITYWPVSTRVNALANDDENLITPLFDEQRDSNWLRID